MTTDGPYWVQIVTNALWYIKNDHITINDAAKHSKDVNKEPDVFEQYAGYNDIKRKKMKSLPLSKQTLN